MTAEMSVQITLALANIIIIYLYPSAGTGRQDNLKIYWFNIVNVQVVFRIKYIENLARGHSLTGKTTILHIVISGSSPDVSKFISSRSSIGWAGSWSDLGCKFKSYLGQSFLCNILPKVYYSYYMFN